jgi:hypothetical protein
MDENIPMQLHLIRENDEVDVLLLPYKDGRGWSYVNLTNPHICSCVFPDKISALNDLNNHEIHGYSTKNLI